MVRSVFGSLEIDSYISTLLSNMCSRDHGMSGSRAGILRGNLAMREGKMECNKVGRSVFFVDTSCFMTTKCNRVRWLSGEINRDECKLAQTLDIKQNKCFLR